MENLNRIDEINSLENQFLLFNMTEKDQPEKLSDNFIQHKIDSKNLCQIKWTKLQQLLQECINEYSSCHYELRIYNITSGDESIGEILNNIKKIAEILECNCDIINTKKGIFGVFIEFFLKLKNTKEESKIDNIKLNKYQEIKIGTFGEESSGKSTTTSVLLNNALDDGNGLMSKKNYKSQNEIISGKSLYISHLVLGLDKNNMPINETNLDKLIEKSSKFINIYDMGGSDKAMKNTLSLISPDYIDYALLFIDYKNGATENTKKLFSLNYSGHIPMICIITMIDLVKDQNEKELYDFIEKNIKLLSSVNPNIKSFYITNQSEVLDYIAKLNNSYEIENYLPIICISNVKGNNIELLKYLLTLLPTSGLRAIPLLNNSFEKNDFNLITSPINQFDVHEHFTVKGKTILGGIVSKGIINKNDTYYFGPNKLGNFKIVKVETIHCKMKEVDIIHEGQYSSLSLTGSNYDPNEVSKGMCLIGTNTAFVPKAVRKFKADVWWIGEEQMKEMKYKCEPVIIINHIRETCKIINMNKNKSVANNASYTENSSTSEFTGEFSMTSKTGSLIASSVEFEDDNNHLKKKKKKIKTNLKEETFWLSRDEKMELVFEFKNFPKLINEGQTIVINDNTFKAFGIITKVIYPEDEKILFSTNPINKKK